MSGGLAQSVSIKEALSGGPKGVHIGLQHISGNTAAQHLGQETGRDGLALKNIPVDMAAGKENLVEHT